MICLPHIPKIHFPRHLFELMFGAARVKHSVTMAKQPLGRPLSLLITVPLQLGKAGSIAWCRIQLHMTPHGSRKCDPRRAGYSICQAKSLSIAPTHCNMSCCYRPNRHVLFFSRNVLCNLLLNYLTYG